MIELSGEQIAEFWHRSYTSVDGLWFMKVEEKHGFDAVLDIDNEVWKVLPKIQARMMKSLGKAEDGMDGLFECVTTKLSLEGFVFEAEKAGDGSGFRILLSRCPWHEIMVRSGREELSGRIGRLICNTEYSVWASEFGDNIRVELKAQICEGGELCILEFSEVVG
jgi:hypothetical protein